MIAAGNDGQRAFVHGVNQAVAVVDAARPESCQIGLECFGFADTGKGRAQGIFDEQVDALQGLFILCLPVKVILPSLIGEGEQAFSHQRVPAGRLGRFGTGQWSVAGGRRWRAFSAGAGFRSGCCRYRATSPRHLRRCGG